MTQSDLLTYLDHPENFNEESLNHFSELVEKYPYFTLARALHAANSLYLKKENSEQLLQEVAIYLSCREPFYYLIRKIRKEHDDRHNRPNEKQVENSPTVSKANPIGNIIEAQFEDSSNTLDENGDFIPTTLININKDYIDNLELVDSTENKTEPDKDQAEKYDLDVEESKVNKNVRKQVSEAKDLLEIDYREKQVQINEDVKEVPEVEQQNPVSKEFAHYDLELIYGDDDSNQMNDNLIESFLKSNPKIKPIEDKPIEQDDISEHSIREDEGLITDTLARIYINQGYYSKAIFAYEKLSLKYPEKNSYFAAQIDKIRKLIDSKL